MLLVAGLAAVSCLNKEDMENKLKELDQRISKLEEAAGIANDNSVALRAFLQKETLVVGLKEIEHGYELELNDGSKVTVIDGLNAPAIIPVVGVDQNGDWVMSLDNGETFSAINGADNALLQTGQTPQLKVDENGYWLVSLDGGKTFSQIKDKDGNPQGSVAGAGSAFFEDVAYDAQKKVLNIALMTGEALSVPVVDTFYLNVPDFTPMSVIYLDQTKEYEVEMSEVKDALFQVPEGWAAVLTDEALQITGPAAGTAGEYTINLVITSTKGYIKHLSFTFTLKAMKEDEDACQTYKDWVAQNENNLLLDFSYAGYDHGESAPLEASAWGYTVYDVTAYGAVANDGKSDRDAFKKCLEAATGQTFASGNTTLTLGAKEKANAIIYFPEGEFILHTTEDNHTVDGKEYSQTIMIRSGNIILRGAGRDKTTLVMADPNLPKDAALYSSPVMLDFKHNSGLGDKAGGVAIDVAVTENAPKGSFSVKVASTAGLAADAWVCLSVQNNDPAYVAKELEGGAPTAAELAGMTDIVNGGVKVFEYHKIRSVKDNVVTFYEPIHKDVDISYTAFTGTDSYNWKLLSYPHYENIGVEDLTFRGYAKADFAHHGSWEDDGAFKPLQFTRVTNSWIRRVRFTSVSEAMTISNSANVSAYDIIIDGNRGHSAIRSQASTRVFIGAVVDKSSGPKDDGSGYEEAAGQYHAVGVSKPSMGAVLWRNTWGFDSCFESHATQPRATLIDCCKGGWVASRQGGDENQVPNHLDDLTIWNFEATNVRGSWIWWNHDSKWHKFLPPTVVGFHGASVSFDPTQVKADVSNGIPVNPESLYEAQLKERLGAVPAWLNSLK